MDTESLKEMGIRSCSDMMEQIDAMRRGAKPKDNDKISMSVTEVKSIHRKPGYLKLELFGTVTDVDTLGLCIENTDQRFYFSDDSVSDLHVTFQDYDEESKTISAYPSEKLMALVNSHPDEDIKVIVDMKWLIALTKKTFEERGDALSLPKGPPCFKEGEDYDFPKGQEPTDQQRDAVRTILNSRLSYIWGAPGTGKTQFVLSTAVIAHIKRGGRVAIFAPTNNSVEQVLRGVMKVLQTDDPDHQYIDPDTDILRLGSATSDFLRDYPNICENKAINQKLDNLKRTNRTILSVLFERKVDGMMKDFDSIQELYEEEDACSTVSGKRSIKERISGIWDGICGVIRRNTMFSGLIQNVNTENLRMQSESIRRRLIDRERPVLEIDHYSGKDESQLNEMIESNQSEIDKYTELSTAYREKHVKILAMTPFILMARPTLFGEGGVPDMDQIFVDEAGYANLIQFMPLFMCGPPIAMLGDHMQLPPVCELDRDDLITWSQREGDGYMRYGFMWDTSVRYAERFFTEDEKTLIQDYVDCREPVYRFTSACDLTFSHRFADNLARVLDRCVYKNGIKGHSGEALRVFCCDVKGTNSDVRYNKEEVTAITRFLEEHSEELGDFVVLTPYNEQRKQIYYSNRRFEHRILTVHRSQGREWDTVILSVCDNSNASRKVPYRFTSSLPPNSGLKVMNTAVSRAKKNLIVFCDYNCWKSLGDRGDLLGQIVTDGLLLG